MKNSELKEYLEKFPDDAVLHILAVNPTKRKFYPIEGFECCVDEEFDFPCLLIGLGPAETIDEEETDRNREENKVCIREEKEDPCRNCFGAASNDCQGCWKSAMMDTFLGSRKGDVR